LPKLPVLTAKEAETMLLKAGFKLLRIKGSHKIYIREKERFIIPFHTGKDLHPKITKQLLELIKS
jgi:predicted RNA binding protein YcfA (HicA-like mRNA interferase family)